MPGHSSSALPGRSAYHPARKIFHFATGVLFAVGNESLPRPEWPTFTFSLFLVIMTVEVLRIRAPKGRLNDIILRMFRPFLRSHETRQFAGIAYYTFGIALATLIFPSPAATVGILALAIADPVAALTATYFKHTLPALRLPHGKSVAGTLCAMAAAGLAVFSVVRQAEVSTMLPKDAWMFSTLVAAVAALTELCIPSPRPTYPSKTFPIGLDDNAFIPVLCAAAAHCVLRVTYHTLQLSPLLVFRLPN